MLEEFYFGGKTLEELQYTQGWAQDFLDGYSKIFEA